MGATGMSDMLVLAIKIPNMFRRVFAEGALAQSFIPLFRPLLKDDLKGLKITPEACILSQNLFYFWLGFLTLFTLMFEINASVICTSLVSRISNHTFINLSRITFLSVFFISLASFLGAITNSLGKFHYFALSNSINNIVMIVFILLGLFFGHIDIHMLYVIGMVVSAFSTYLWMHMCLSYEGIHLKFNASYFWQGSILGFYLSSLFIYLFYIPALLSLLSPNLIIISWYVWGYRIFFPLGLWVIYILIHKDQEKKFKHSMLIGKFFMEITQKKSFVYTWMIMMILYCVSGFLIGACATSVQIYLSIFWFAWGILGIIFSLNIIMSYFFHKTDTTQKKIKFYTIIFFPQIKNFLARFIPASLTASANQMNALITLSFTSLLPSGQLTCLYMAEKIHILPYSFLGITLSTVLLPFLSSRNIDENQETQETETLMMVLFLTLPVSLLIYGLATPVVRFCFERGAFGYEEVKITASILRIYSGALPAYVLIKVMNLMCFTKKYTQGPLWAMAVSCCVDIILCVCLIKHFTYLGVAWATTGAAWASVFTLLFLMKKTFQFHIFNKIILIKTLGFLLITAHLLKYTADVWPTKNIFIIGMFGLGAILCLGILCIVGGVVSWVQIQQKILALKIKKN
jgi:peptidoglycan biosynthesis protein MviN/MurJ (putative lipid II flippase)